MLLWSIPFLLVHRVLCRSSSRLRLILLTSLLCCALDEYSVLAADDGAYITINDDSSDDEYRPQFTQQPDTQYYVLKNRPANITCRVRNADSLRIWCFNEPVNANLSRLPVSSGVSVAPGDLDYELEASILVTQNQVHEVFAEYTCRCLATRNISAIALPLDADARQPKRARKLADVSAQSRIASVSVASIGKNFNQEPIDTTTEMDTQGIVLHCRSPEGTPTPEVSWLRDGRQIDPQADTNFVVANDGSLILSRAREFDSGSYVCVAQNVAGTRKTQPAKLVVVVNGGWSPWTTWQACTKKCGLGTQKRVRECNNPRPRNGGLDCDGSNEEKRNCTGTKCGQRPSGSAPSEVWSEWSEWSECFNCLQTRRRFCKDEFSRVCVNHAEETEAYNCCRSTSPFHSLVLEPQQVLQSTAKPTETKQLILYIGLPIAAFVLLAVFILVVLIIVRRLRARSGVRLYGTHENDSTRCLKLGKNSANKGQLGEPNSGTIDIVMNPTAQLISDADINGQQYTYAQGGGTGAAMHESHFHTDPHFAFCASYVDSQPGMNAAHESNQVGSPYLVPFVGSAKQNQIATTNLPSSLEQPSLPVSTMPFSSAARNVQYNSMAVSYSNSVTPPQSVGVNNKGTTHSSASSFVPSNHSQAPMGLFDSAEAALVNVNVNVNSSMRLPPSIAIPPPPPAARNVPATNTFKLSLRSSANGPELTLAGSSCNETRTEATFSELSSIRSDSEADMSELCDPHVGLLRSANTTMTKNELDLERVASPNFACSTTVDRREGCTVCMDHANISVIVPELAFETNKLDLIVTVLRADCEQPNLNSRETLLSPIVQIDCGYSDSRDALSKPCVLSIPHCAVINSAESHRFWRFSVYFNENVDSRKDAHDWQPVAVIDQNGSIVLCSAEISCQVDSRLCHIVTAQFGKYCLVGESAPQCNAVKSLQLAAFARNLSNSLDHKVRVYAIEDHPDALDTVVETESRLGSFLIDTPKRFRFSDGGGNLCLSVEQINSNWKIRTDGCYQEIPFRHIWNSYEKLHCSFSFESGPRSGALAEYFQCTVSVHQKNMISDRERLHIAQPANSRSHSNSTERMAPNSQTMIHTPNNSNTSGIASCSCIVDGVLVAGNCGLAKQCRLISAETRVKLCNLLDDSNGYRADWRRLGQQLGVQQSVLTMVACSGSPTAMLLTLFEAQMRNNEQALQNLYALLRNLGRSDCAALLETEILAHAGRAMIC